MLANGKRHNVQDEDACCAHCAKETPIRILQVIIEYRPKLDSLRDRHGVLDQKIAIRCPQLSDFGFTWI